MVYDINGQAPALCAQGETPANVSCTSFKQSHATVSGNKSIPPVAAADTGEGHMMANADSTGGRIRRLTPAECARLQTIPGWYKWKCSETQQCKMLGNGWTIEIIKHIFKFIKQ